MVFEDIDAVIKTKVTLGKEKNKITTRVICLLQDVCDLKKVSIMLVIIQEIIVRCMECVKM